MAFDVYVGTLTRYYGRDWQNVVQSTFRDQGVSYKIIHAGGEPEPPPPANELRDAIANWRNSLSSSLQPHGFGPVSWDEGDDKPYFTDRPAWDGYGAMLTWAAYAEHPDLPLPVHVPNSWANDLAFQRSVDHKFNSRFRTILQPELWLPTEFPFVFDAPTLTSEKSCIGSTFSLKQQLDELLQQTAGKLEERKNVADTQPPTKKDGFFGKLFSRKIKEPERAKANLAEMAEFGLRVFQDLANKACEHRLPMLLDY